MLPAWGMWTWGAAHMSVQYLHLAKRVILRRDELSPHPHPSAHSLISATQWRLFPTPAPMRLRMGFSLNVRNPPNGGTSCRLGLPEVALNWGGVQRVGEPESGGMSCSPCTHQPWLESLGVCSGLSLALLPGQSLYQVSYVFCIRDKALPRCPQGGCGQGSPTACVIGNGALSHKSHKNQKLGILPASAFPVISAELLFSFIL